ncbi:MAG: nucleotidyltransferase family protein [Lachnospiraceae bacterium]|nr:nucleotidyltransferase family protein [Lachnospiraceae bacterium]
MPKRYLREAVRLYGEGIDLDWAVRISYVHQVYGLFAQNLKEHFPKTQDMDTVKTLLLAANQNRFEAMKMTGELVKLYRIFAENGIRAVPLKGAVLAKMLYADPTCRHATDIDMLIRHEDFDAARKILAERGYTSGKSYVSTPKKTEVYESKFHDYDFVSPNDVKLELHWRVADIRAAEILTCDNAISVISFYGQELPTYTPEEWLVYLAYHGVHHGYMWMKWLVDFETMARYSGVDRKAAMALAEEKGLAWALRASFELVRLTAGVDGAGQENCSNRLALEMFRVLTKSEGQKDETFMAYRSYLDAELLRRGLLSDRERARRIDPSEKDFERFDFSDRFFFLYYIVRGPYKLYRMIADRLGR